MRRRSPSPREHRSAMHSHICSHTPVRTLLRRSRAGRTEWCNPCHSRDHIGSGRGNPSCSHRHTPRSTAEASRTGYRTERHGTPDRTLRAPRRSIRRRDHTPWICDSRPQRLHPTEGPSPPSPESDTPSCKPKCRMPDPHDQRAAQGGSSVRRWVVRGYRSTLFISGERGRPAVPRAEL